MDAENAPRVCAVCSRDNAPSAHHCEHCGALLVAHMQSLSASPSLGQHEPASITPRGTGASLNGTLQATDSNQFAALAPGPSAPVAAVVVSQAPQGSRRKILIQRDYTHGMAVRFDDSPQTQLVMGTSLSSASVQRTVQALNEIFDAIEHVGCCGYVEGCLACLTGFALYWCLRSPYEKGIDRMRELLREENDRVYQPAGFHVRDPMENGLRMIEIVEL